MNKRLFANHPQHIAFHTKLYSHPFLILNSSVGTLIKSLILHESNSTRTYTSWKNTTWIKYLLINVEKSM